MRGSAARPFIGARTSLSLSLSLARNRVHDNENAAARVLMTQNPQECRERDKRRDARSLVWASSSFGAKFHAPIYQVRPSRSRPRIEIVVRTSKLSRGFPSSRRETGEVRHETEITARRLSAFGALIFHAVKNPSRKYSE